MIKFKYIIIILLNLKKEGNPEICDNTDKPGGLY